MHILLYLAHCESRVRSTSLQSLHRLRLEVLPLHFLPIFVSNQHFTDQHSLLVLSSLLLRLLRQRQRSQTPNRTCSLPVAGQGQSRGAEERRFLEDGASKLGRVKRERINELSKRVCGVGNVRVRRSQRTGWALGRKRDFDGRGDDADVVVSKHPLERWSLAPYLVQ
ncbi:hypothetical protein V8G54_025700 [Vigna mungo]|uniref:Uncharacterized protein n=1 Tax=Vigna mungo TaxID=3915 RepID=A0AAQ3MZN4_VIGMU